MVYFIFSTKQKLIFRLAIEFWRTVTEIAMLVVIYLPLSLTHQENHRYADLINAVAKMKGT